MHFVLLLNIFFIICGNEDLTKYSENFRKMHMKLARNLKVQFFIAETFLLLSFIRK